VDKTIEIGHIFQLGTRYSESLGASVLDEHGETVTLRMGSYGIGVGRALAAVVEAHHDGDGIAWPVTVAPFEVVVSVLNPRDVQTAETGERLYDALRGAGVDVILDDRDERPGVKFKDAELVGIPYRVTVGPKGLAKGVVELKSRHSGETRELEVDHAATNVAETVISARR